MTPNLIICFLTTLSSTPNLIKRKSGKRATEERMTVKRVTRNKNTKKTKKNNFFFKLGVKGSNYVSNDQIMGQMIKLGVK